MHHSITHKTRVGVLALLLATALLGGGCTTFDYEWKESAAGPAPTTELEGRWQGLWHSDASGHEGKLRCLVTKIENGAYRARFHAKYRKVLSFGYTAPLTVERTVNAFNFSGEADLGWLAGGVYRYDGHADATNFFSNYSSKYDHGTFQMTRP